MEEAQPTQQDTSTETHEAMVGKRAHEEDSGARCQRVCEPICRFIESEHVQWSGDVRIGHRHERTRESGEGYEELRAEVHESRKLRARLGDFQQQLRGLARDFDALSSDSMELKFTAAQVTLQAILEVMDENSSNQQQDEGSAGDIGAFYAAEEASSTTSKRLTGYPVKHGGVTGCLQFLPMELQWQPTSNSGVIVMPFVTAFAEIETWDSDDDGATCELVLTNGRTLFLQFGDASSDILYSLALLALFEEDLRAARHHVAHTKPTNVTEPVNNAAEPAVTGTESDQSDLVAARPPRAPTKRVQLGLEARDLLKEVMKLRGRHKVIDAKLLLDSGLAESRLAQSTSTATVKKRAQELRTTLFSFGGLSLTKGILAHFLNLPEVRLLLPDEFQKQQADATDAATARQLLSAAKTFINTILTKLDGGGTHRRGRRKATDCNAFWASVAALLPRDLFEARQGRAAMRLLGISYRVAKQAVNIRSKIEDVAKGWVAIESSGHNDKVDGSIMAAYWHEVASTEDNQHKECYRVYCGRDDAGNEQYTFHWRRAQIGTDKECFANFLTSEYGKAFRAATVTKSRPQGARGDIHLFTRMKCTCIRKRGASECDCKICSRLEVNWFRWNRARPGWRQGKVCCSCKICSDETRRPKYLELSRSVACMWRILVPCGKQRFDGVALDGQPFFFYRGACCYGKCPKRGIMRRFLEGEHASCGWDDVFGKSDCPLESGSEPFRWEDWEPRQKGLDDEGNPRMEDEFVPVNGTRGEFMAMLRSAAAAYLKHMWHHILQQRSIKVNEQLKDDLALTVRADYAAQIESMRARHATCTTKERHNMCVYVCGFKPYNEEVFVARRGKRPEQTKVVRKQHVYVFYAFHKAGYRPDARTYNILAEDVTHFLKHGNFLHGEAFNRGQRIPGGDHRAELPEWCSDAPLAPPVHPALERETHIVDGCAAQFAGRNNYYQVAVWKTKTGVVRRQCTLTAMMGKSICDGLSNPIAGEIKMAVQRGDSINPGTRSLVLHLAQHKPTPVQAKVKKEGWWAVSEIFYLWYESDRFKVTVVPEAKGFSGSKEKHSLAGICADAEKARLEGPLHVGHVFCGCKSCTVFEFHNCLMKDELGLLKQPVEGGCHRDTTISPNEPSQSQTLEEWAATLVAGTVGVIRAARDEIALEGRYWLCLLHEKPYQLTREELHAGEHFQPGWWVAKAQFYSLVQTSERAYKLGREFLLNINAMVRVAAPKFEGGTRISRTGLRRLSEREHVRILESL